MMLEVVVGALLVAAAMVIVVQVVGRVAAGRRPAERRQRAVQEAANLMERLAARPWDELTPAAARSLAASAATSARDALGDGSIEADVASVAGDPTAKRVAIEVRPGDRSGGRSAPVRLVAWVHRRGGARP